MLVYRPQRAAPARDAGVTDVGSQIGSSREIGEELRPCVGERHVVEVEAALRPARRQLGDQSIARRLEGLVGGGVRVVGRVRAAAEIGASLVLQSLLDEP